MVRLVLALILSGFGGTFILHYLKNFLLKEKSKLFLDWDGLIERTSIAYIVLGAPHLWIFIPILVVLKILYRLSLLGFIPGITQSGEPGISSQKVLLKAELAFDLLLSPAFAFLVGVIFK